MGTVIFLYESRSAHTSQNISGDQARLPIILLATVAGAAGQPSLLSVNKKTRTPCASTVVSGREPQIVPGMSTPYETEAISAREALAGRFALPGVAGAQTSNPEKDFVETSP